MTSPLSYLVGQPLTWVPTAALKSRYDLVAPDGSVLATLEMSNWTYKNVPGVVQAGNLSLRTGAPSAGRSSTFGAPRKPGQIRLATPRLSNSLLLGSRANSLPRSTLWPQRSLNFLLCWFSVSTFLLLKEANLLRPLLWPLLWPLLVPLVSIFK